MSKSDHIIIQDLAVFAKHGVSEEEKKLGQKFLVSAELYIDTSIAGLSDQLSGTIDYARVCHYIEKFMTTHTYNLLEAVAEYLARDLLLRMKPLLQKVTITIKKPSAPVGLIFGNVGVTITRKWNTAYLSIGSNMGDKNKHLKNAVSAFTKHKLCRVTKTSDFITTKPYGNDDQEDFLNGVFEIKTLLTPVELLSLCDSIEQKEGRVRTEHWGPRTLDVDILFYNNEVINMKSPSLIIPHCDLHNRYFVLKPMDMIAPAYIHPLYLKTVRQMLTEVENKETGN